MITNDSVERLPLLPLRGMLIFPGCTSFLDVARNRSMAALAACMANEEHEILLVSQRDAGVDEPQQTDLYTVGVVAAVRHMIRMPDETMRVLCEAQRRVLLIGTLNRPDYMEGSFVPMAEIESGPDIVRAAHVRRVRELFREVCAARGQMPGELLDAVDGMADAGRLSDTIAQNAITDLKDRQSLLECRDAFQRLTLLTSLLTREAEIARIDREIEAKVNSSMEKNQREYYLREQIKVIQTELGNDEAQETEKYRQQLENTPMNDEARDKVAREIDRFSHMMGGTPEMNVSATYIEQMLAMPWGRTTSKDIQIDKARKVLEKDHYGLEKVKERILEYLAVRAMTGSLRGPILCLVGAPGVGKTSIASSVARALGRKFVRMSLGGVHDEAEIRGHRRTYIGAMPGRIMMGLRQCGSCDPVFLFDEIDKLASDYRGDPSSALLEALDPEQNSTFTDHYLDAPFDLSRVLFIATANTTDTIPPALLDRMELIEVPSYTLEEKVQIAKRHLWPKQLKEHKLTRSMVSLPDKSLRAVIEGYTREAGVRSLERELAALCRKADMALVDVPEDQRQKIVITPESLTEYLGAPRFLDMEPDREPETGVVNGLAWTQVGGTTMPIEVAVMPGQGAIEMTGRLGDVMKESARTALSYIRSRSRELGLDDEFHKKNDIHIHVPEGAVPKDGPSAGVALTCAMVSALTGIPARQDAAMTGEITLRGHVLPIGGVKEKLLAAYRLGITTLLLPSGNEKDLTELPKDVRDHLDIHLLKQVDEALNLLLIR